MKKLLAILITIFSLVPFVHGQVETQWTSQAVVAGERTLFYIFVMNGETASVEPFPHVPGASLRPLRSSYAQMPGAKNNVAQYFELEVIADKPGTVVLPPFTLRTQNGHVYQTREQLLTVYPHSAIKWQPLPQSNGQLQYGTLWHVGNKAPFINEVVECEIKFYLPPEIVDFQPPSIQKNGVVARNFGIFRISGNSPINQGTVLAKGLDWNVISFNSVFNPTRAGDVSMSGTAMAFALKNTRDPVLAQFMQDYIELSLTIPQIDIKARDYPPGAPPTFTNAVGEFNIKASTSALDLSANDPIMVDITIEGSGPGNINSLECPLPVDSSNWKLYPATRMGDAVYNGGKSVVRFQQSMRPLQEVNAVPSFTLTYLNPRTEQYHTVTSPAIQLPWKSSAVAVAGGQSDVMALPPAEGIVPVEEMTDIYGLVPAKVIAALSTQTSWLWYLLAYIPFVAIIILSLCKYIRNKHEQSAEARERLEAFRQIDAKASPSAFLRNVGSFIETYIPTSELDESLQDVLKQRDEQAFLPDHAVTELDAAQRSTIMSTVRKAINKLPLLLACVLALGSGSLYGQDSKGEELYTQGEFTQAVKAFSEQAGTPREQAANYYGLGNSLYRLNKPGEAALAYSRALNLCPGFTEARRNLSFIQRKEGALMPPKNVKNEWLTFVPRHWLMPIIILASAVCLTSLATLLCFRRYTVLLSIASVIFMLATAAGITNLVLYPQVPANTPADRLLIVKTAAPARHAADKDSPAIITLPPSTPLILVADRGSWYYVHTFTGTPAWIEAAHAETVTPHNH